MPNSRKSHPPSLKAKVAVEAIRGQRTTAQIAQVYSIQPALVSARSTRDQPFDQR